jgi:hypothetical protein
MRIWIRHWQFWKSLKRTSIRVKAARPKTKGNRKVLNLVSSINYGDFSPSSRRRKDKAYMV